MLVAKVGKTKEVDNMSKETIKRGVPSHKTVHDGSHGPGCTDCVANMAKKGPDADSAYDRPIPGEAGARKLVANALRNKK